MPHSRRARKMGLIDGACLASGTGHQVPADAVTDLDAALPLPCLPRLVLLAAKDSASPRIRCRADGLPGGDEWPHRTARRVLTVEP